MDAQDAPLSPAQRSRIRRLSRPREPQPGDEAGELNIVPYLDIIMNIVVFVMTTLSVIFYTTIDSEPPSLGGSGKVRERTASKALNLVALVVNEGVTLKTSGGQIDTGCQQLGAGVTVPRLADGEHDMAALTKCARYLKSQNERFAEETQVTLTANPGTPYREVIQVIDALRKDEGPNPIDDRWRCDPVSKTNADRRGCLFPDIHFGQAR